MSPLAYYTMRGVVWKKSAAPPVCFAAAKSAVLGQFRQKSPLFGLLRRGRIPAKFEIPVSAGMVHGTGVLPEFYFSAAPILLPPQLPPLSFRNLLRNAFAGQFIARIFIEHAMPPPLPQ